MKAIISASLMFVLLSCSDINHEEKDRIERCIIGFSEAYFNYELNKACDYSTADSRKWLEYIASNIDDNDLAVINAQDTYADVSIVDIEYNSSDSTGMTTVEVNNFYALDTIGNHGHIVSNAKFNINFIKENGGYKVKMAGPLRSERQDLSLDEDL